jgi:hypothetical protein
VSLCFFIFGLICLVSDSYGWAAFWLVLAYMCKERE